MAAKLNGLNLHLHDSSIPNALGLYALEHVPNRSHLHDLHVSVIDYVRTWLVYSE